MAVLKMNVPNAELQRILDGAGEFLGYEEGALTKHRFVELQMIRQVKEWAASGEIQVDQHNRTLTAEREINEIDIT